MKPWKVRQRVGRRYLRREAKAGRTRQRGYLPPHAAVCWQDGTTNAAERRHWPYMSRLKPCEVDAAWQRLAQPHHELLLDVSWCDTCGGPCRDES